MATSPPISHYMQRGGDIYIGKAYSIKMSQDKILNRLKAEGYTFEQDTAQQKFRKVNNYLIKNVVLNKGKDTIKSIEFGLMGQGEKTVLLLNNVSLNGNKKISDWRVLKMY